MPDKPKTPVQRPTKPTERPKPDYRDNIRKDEADDAPPTIRDEDAVPLPPAEDKE